MVDLALLGGNFSYLISRKAFSSLESFPVSLQTHETVLVST